MNNPIQFARKMLDFMRGELDEEESKAMRQTIDANEQLKAIEHDFADKEYISREMSRMQSFDVEAALSRVLESINVQEPTSRVQPCETVATPHLLTSSSPHLLIKVAAAVALLLAVGGAIWFHQYAKVTPPELSQDVLTAITRGEKSGRVMATTQLLDPTSPQLVDSTSPQLLDPSAAPQRSAWVARVMESLEDDSKDEVRQMGITTRSANEYWLSLPDGSLVHLNYNTRVIYPEVFVGQTRDVILEGEAYFMVAKDRRHPFVVHTAAGETRVYGTEFNINTREDTTEVVLVRGSISVTPTNGSEQMLTPGQKCSLFNAQCSLEEVDTAPYVAWNTGTFVFDNVPLQQLMDVLSHWYGFEVSFVSEEAREKHFTGELDRYGSIKPTLEAIANVTGLHLYIENGAIVIEN